MTFSCQTYRTEVSELFIVEALNLYAVHDLLGIGSELSKLSLHRLFMMLVEIGARLEGLDILSLIVNLLYLTARLPAPSSAFCSRRNPSFLVILRISISRDSISIMLSWF